MQKAITDLNLSKGSGWVANGLRKTGAKEKESTTLWRVDLGSNILTGRDIWEIPSPLKKFFAS